MMKVASVSSSQKKLDISVNSSIDIKTPVAHSGYGTEVRGGDFLLISISACFTNNIYWIAVEEEIKVEQLTIESRYNFSIGDNLENKVIINVSIVSPEKRSKIDQLLLRAKETSTILNIIKPSIEIRLQ